MRDGIQVNQHRIIKKNVLPSELMMLKAGEGYINFSGFAPARFKFNTKPLPKLAEGYVENTELYELFKKECEGAEARRREIEQKLNTNLISDRSELQLDNDQKSKKVRKIYEAKEIEQQDGQW